MENINDILTFCGIHDDKIIKNVKKILKICDLNNYEGIAALQNEDFINKCESFLEKNGQYLISPGLQIILQKVGNAVSDLGKEKFNDFFCDIKTTEKFPLLVGLNNQTVNSTYSKTIKDFATLIRLKSGPETYELLSENLPFPATSTINNYLTKYEHVNEGELQIEALKEHLKSCGCTESENKIWVAEDATAILSRVEYKPDSDQVIGFVPPLCPVSGLPEVNKFPATSPSIVKGYFDQNNKSKSVYAMVAVPFSHKATPFVIAIFGTDNKFNHEHVLKRFSYIKQKCAEANIEVVGYGSDGDTKMLKAMKISSGLGRKLEIDEIKDEWKQLFFANFENEFICFQDHFHIISKIRTRLLETSCPMKIGTHKVSLATLRCLIKDQPELKKLVRPSDFSPDDKMNVTAGQRLCQKEVLKYIDDPGLKQVLSLLRDFIDAFEDQGMSVEEKIFKAWTFNFVLRAWRHSIFKDPNKRMTEFIAYPTYNCIELNCHSLIGFYRLLRNSGSLNDFNYLNKCTSQACEALFRRYRSLTTLNWTSINMSMLEVCYKTNRINAMCKLEHSLQTEVNIPRLGKVNKSMKDVDDISDDKILETLLKAKNAAEKICNEMGIVLAESSFMYINSEDLKIKSEQSKIDGDINLFQFCEPSGAYGIDDDHIYLTSNDPLEDTTTFILNEDNVASTSSTYDNPLEGTSTMDPTDIEDDVNILKKYCGFFVQRFTQAPDKADKSYFFVKDGNEWLRVRKDAFVRIFNETDFLSKDRNKRFISKKKVQVQKPYDGKYVLKHNSIALSDWIIVRNFDGIARVLEFKDVSAKTISQGRVKVSAIEIEDKKYENVGFLLEYHTIKANGELKLADVREVNDAIFLSVQEYRLHVPPPDIDGNVKHLNENVLQQLSLYIVINPSHSGFKKEFGALSGKKNIKKEPTKTQKGKKIADKSANENKQQPQKKNTKQQEKRKGAPDDDESEFDVKNKQQPPKKKNKQQQQTSHSNNQNKKKSKTNQQKKRKTEIEESDSDAEYRALQNIKKRKRMPLQTIN